jgi:two-component system response regulator MprA
LINNSDVTAHRVLVVDDDHGLRDVVARGLREEGFDVCTAADGAGTLRTAHRRSLDAIVLDVGLPDSDGRDVCQALRSQGLAMPVLFLTARDRIGDRLSGFSSGGDDYLTKPFAFPELVARLRAVLSRWSESPAVAWDGLSVDPLSHSLSSGSVQVALSPTEFKLMARLMAAPGSIVRRRQLVDAAWPSGAIVSENTLDQYVSRLRRKLADVGSTHTIRAARGVGYELG